MYIGTINDTAENIMDTGLQCLEEFGDYDYRSNNCEHFCNRLTDRLLEKIRKSKRSETKTVTPKESGDEWTAGQVMAAGATVVAGIGLLGYLFGGGEDDSKGGRKSTKRKRDKVL